MGLKPPEYQTVGATPAPPETLPYRVAVHGKISPVRTFRSGTGRRAYHMVSELERSTGHSGDVTGRTRTEWNGRITGTLIQRGNGVTTVTRSGPKEAPERLPGPGGGLIGEA